MADPIKARLVEFEHRLQLLAIQISDLRYLEVLEAAARDPLIFRAIELRRAEIQRDQFGASADDKTDDTDDEDVAPFDPELYRIEAQRLMLEMLDRPVPIQRDPDRIAVMNDEVDMSPTTTPGCSTGERDGRMRDPATCAHGVWDIFPGDANEVRCHFCNTATKDAGERGDVGLACERGELASCPEDACGEHGCVLPQGHPAHRNATGMFFLGGDPTDAATVDSPDVAPPKRSVVRALRVNTGFGPVTVGVFEGETDEQVVADVLQRVHGDDDPEDP